MGKNHHEIAPDNEFILFYLADYDHHMLTSKTVIKIYSNFLMIICIFLHSHQNIINVHANQMAVYQLLLHFFLQ